MLNTTAIPPDTIAVAQRLGSLTKGYVLGGGTAVALHLGHRSSHDLDLLSQNGSETIATSRTLSTLSSTDLQFQTVLRSPTQMDSIVEGVKVSWIGYPFNMVDAGEKWYSIRVASLLDAAAMKAYTIGRRVAARDYLDLHAILTNGIEPEAIAARAETIFQIDGQPVFDRHLFAKQLNYAADCDDVEAAMSEVVDSQLEWNDVVKTLSSVASRWVHQEVSPNHDRGDIL